MIDPTDDAAAAVFSARRVRSRLRVDNTPPIQAFRDTLAWGRERLFGLFHDGAPADALVHARAHLVDEILREAWTRIIGESTRHLALIAVGGYGRGELLPHSDIDLLLLHDETLETHRDNLEKFFAFLWDIGLEVGSGVRTIEQCVELATGDITVMTNLIESRPLIGDEALYGQLMARLTPDKVWPVDAFFRAKLEEQERRHAKYDDTGYKLEPNVKEGPGGLRDIHTIAWVAKRHFGAQTLVELRDRGFLTKAECDELFAGQDFLWRVRFALHMITGRHEDRLLFDHQIKLAELFGYVDQDHNRAVEQFMQLYYRTIKALSCLNDMLLQLFDEAILNRDADKQPEPLNPRFQVRGGYIEARDDEVFQKYPPALIEVFALMQRNPAIEGIRASTLRMIQRDRFLIDDEFRNDVRVRSLFIEMFREGRGLTHALRRMNRYGVLGRLLPLFGRIIGHMQYDLFHTLTVDEHSLYVVRNLRRMAMTRFRHELPFCSELMDKIEKKELLYIAGMFHDLAKGRGGDHSELGADDAIRFCLDHGLSHADTDLVAWLVKNHLMMSLTAQRQDISNPQIVTEFARKVGERGRLDYLFLLTVADIRATNPALWNSWRATLLKDLFLSAARALERGLDNPVSEAERVAEQRRAALTLLTQKGFDAARAEAIWSRFENEYFLRHSPTELAWHLPAIADAKEADLPLVLISPTGTTTTVFIYMHDRDHLFGLATGMLARLGLNILDARIATTADGYVLDSFVITESDGTQLHGDHRIDEIRDGLRKVLGDPAISVIDVNRRRSTRLRHFNTPTSVRFAQDAVRKRTMLELVAADQPGLLSLIGRVFQKRGILLASAKIATIGERAEDVFYITDRAHQPITSDRVLDELREVLTRTFDHVATH